MPPTAILSIFLRKLWRARTVGPVFPAVLLPVFFLNFFVQIDVPTGKCKKKSSSLLELRTWLRFRLYKEKLVCSYKTIHDEKAKSDQKTLCTCHLISGYVVHHVAFPFSPPGTGAVLMPWHVPVCDTSPFLRAQANDHTTSIAVLLPWTKKKAPPPDIRGEKNTVRSCDIIMIIVDNLRSAQGRARSSVTIGESFALCWSRVGLST